MDASTIFHKTPKGLSEIETKSSALSLKERRVLILVNGHNDAATLRQLSLCENVVEILETLVDLGFIEGDGAPDAIAGASTPAHEPRSADDISAGEFMCNALLTFANRVRVGKLIEEINACADIDTLRNMVQPWYLALAETPGGMYQADDLRAQVLRMIEVEEIAGFR
ncbi:MAG: hypothetical protein OEN02_00290 [Gammaproteobacteria bacterium]|nr:hypothetical protein [Gammaproteobacteria bacterium]MDH3537006.1 hypothetical protein [Gammaproteobacteria bacterium]